MTRMSLTTFFLDGIALSGIDEETFQLPVGPDDLEHMHALRFQPGERFAVVDGNSDYFVCEVVSLDKGSVEVRISTKDRIGPSDAALPRVTLFQGLPKASKFDDVVRQCTEIGVDAFAPFTSERSIPRLDGPKTEKKLRRWSSVARSASMQSGRRSIPEIRPICGFEEAVAHMASHDVLVLFWEGETEAVPLESVLAGTSPSTSIAIVIGPEGGFSEEEASAMLEACGSSGACSLGDTILRTETAAVVGCALVIHAIGGLGATSPSAVEIPLEGE